jgi:hypothetical protein
MSRFRQISWQLGLLILSWSDLVQKFEPFEPSDPLSLGWWSYLAVSILVDLAVVGLIVWGLLGEARSARVDIKPAGIHVRRLAVLGLLAASSLPIVLAVMFVAAPLRVRRPPHFRTEHPSCRDTDPARDHCVSAPGV